MQHSRKLSHSQSANIEGEDLLKRSEKVFNAQSAAQKMKIFNEMEQFIKQETHSAFAGKPILKSSPQKRANVPHEEYGMNSSQGAARKSRAQRSGSGGKKQSKGSPREFSTSKTPNKEKIDFITKNITAISIQKSPRSDKSSKSDKKKKKVPKTVAVDLGSVDFVQRNQGDNVNPATVTEILS